jgi:hypothetical protein
LDYAFEEDRNWILSSKRERIRFQTYFISASFVVFADIQTWINVDATDAQRLLTEFVITNMAVSAQKST